MSRLSMSALSSAAVLAFCVAALSGCDRDMMSERGFRLPEGDVMAGREAFLYMQCHQCHSIVGEELPALPLADPPYVELGGNVTKVRTYGELVTSIINPSHKLASGYAEELVSEDGESNMYNYNRHMTVQELTDIVMFLQPHYEVVTPDYQFYMHP